MLPVVTVTVLWWRYDFVVTVTLFVVMVTFFAVLDSRLCDGYTVVTVTLL